MSGGSGGGGAGGGYSQQGGYYDSKGGYYQQQQQAGYPQQQQGHPGGGGGGGVRPRVPQQGGYAAPTAPSTGQLRSGHIEVDTLYGAGGASGQLSVNSMNAPNNSTMQCGCENIDCPFCNLMLSVQMKDSY